LLQQQVFSFLLSGMALIIGIWLRCNETSDRKRREMLQRSPYRRASA
jgi:hypothetical protein